MVDKAVAVLGTERQRFSNQTTTNAPRTWTSQGTNGVQLRDTVRGSTRTLISAVPADACTPRDRKVAQWNAVFGGILECDRRFLHAFSLSRDLATPLGVTSGSKTVQVASKDENLIA